MNGVDVAIVGAGLSGLSAAHRLRAQGIENIVIIEARGNAGGRAWRELYGDHLVISRGGAWVGPSQQSVLEMAAAYGIETFPAVPDVLRDEYRVRGEVVERVRDAEVAAVARPDEVRVVYDEFARIVDGIDRHRPWDSPAAADLDGITLRTWISERVGDDPDLKDLVEEMFIRPIGMSPAEVSVLSVAAYFAGSGGVVAHDEGAVLERVVGGAGRIVDSLADDFRPVLRTSCPVRQITWDEHGAELYIDGETVRAARVIVAMSPSNAAQIDFSPLLPRRRRQLQDGWLQPGLIKTSFVYDEPFWWADGLTGRAVVDAPGRFTMRDDSPSDGRYGILVGFSYPSAGSSSLTLEADSDDRGTRTKLMLDAIVELFGERAADPQVVVETDWGSEPWIGGCIGLPRAGVLSAYGSTLREPVGVLHWAGTETATDWPNHLNGAVQAGQRAADEVVELLRSYD